MFQMEPCCQLPNVKTETLQYYEYYLGDKDQQGRKHGQGQNCWTGPESIEWHSGSFVRDTMHGTGEYRWRYRGSPGLWVSYEGAMHVNRLHGYGTMSYPDGRVFSGLFKNDVRYGPGVESFADLHQNVGLWHGTRLARLAWAPEAPSVAPLLGKHNIRYLADPHRTILKASFKTFGKVNQAVEFLKQHGSDPVAATENWSRLYPKHCTDLDSQLCHVELFENHYYNGKMSLLKECSNDEMVHYTSPYNNESENEGFELTEPQEKYYAWNNSDVTVDMMKHSFQHNWQREVTHIDLVSLLSGPRSNFKPPALHELDSRYGLFLLEIASAYIYRTLLMSSYLGHVASTMYLVNEQRVDPNIADMHGNTPVIYAVCGDQPILMEFLVKAGADVNGVNDSCCTALGIALLRYACAKRDIPVSGMTQALIPPAKVASVAPEPQQIFEWNINRDVQTSEHLKHIQPQYNTNTHQAKMNMKDLSPPKKKNDYMTEKAIVITSFDELPDGKAKLYRDINKEYETKVNELFNTVVGQPPKYLYDITVEEVVIDEPPPLKGADKSAKNKISTELKDTTKLSKETIMHYGLKDEEFSQNNFELLKQEQCDRILWTILRLLGRGANPQLVRCPQPALMTAIAAGCADLVEYLVRFGANVNEVYPEVENYSSLDLAVAQPLTQMSLDTVRVLLESGARADGSVQTAPPLLHRLVMRKTKNEYEEDILKNLIRVLLEYNCDPLQLYNDQSALAMATRDVKLLDVIIRNPTTNLNAPINKSNETILMRMFHMPFFRKLDSNEHSQMLTNLLLFGADPLIECEADGVKYKNLFVLAKNTLTGLCNQIKPSGSPNESKNQKSSPQTQTKGKSQKGNLDPAKGKGREPKKEDVKNALSHDCSNLQQAIELMTECSRILYIRWLQAQLAKDLIQVIAKYKHRHWSMIIKEHKKEKTTSLWLTAQQCIEIWRHLNTTKKKIYEDKAILWRLLCIIHFYHLRSRTNHGFEKVTSVEKDDTESYVRQILKENKRNQMLPLQRYVQPELFVNADSKYNVCFECFLPLDDKHLVCKSCNIVSFCNLVCLRESIRKSNEHVCNDLLSQEFMSPETESYSSETHIDGPTKSTTR